MPMGPIALHDIVGLDTACYAGKVLADGLSRPGRADAAPRRPGRGRPARPEVGRGLPQVRRQVGKPEPDPAVRRRSWRSTGPATATPGDEEITDRLFLPMLLEATRVLEEGIVREPADVDMGLILGVGFPPFRGGILRWADTEGAGTIVERLDAVSPRSGKRFEPTETLIAAGEDRREVLPGSQDHRARRRRREGLSPYRDRPRG